MNIAKSVSKTDLKREIKTNLILHKGKNAVIVLGQFLREKLS